MLGFARPSLSSSSSSDEEEDEEHEEEESEDDEEEPEEELLDFGASGTFSWNKWQKYLDTVGCGCKETFTTFNYTYQNFSGSSSWSFPLFTDQKLLFLLSVQRNHQIVDEILMK